MDHFFDTICAPATSVGSGAVSLIRISGPEALSVVDRVVRFRSGTAAAAPGYSLKYGEAEGLDEVLVSLFRGPHSYTGEDAAEICCHASPYIVSILLERLTGAGCRLADPGEFTRRAFLNGKMDLAQAESVADVIASSSSAQHRVAMNQLRGGYSAELRGLRRQLLELTFANYWIQPARIAASWQIPSAWAMPSAMECRWPSSAPRTAGRAPC